MNRYIFSVVKNAREIPVEQPRREWNDLTLNEAAALYSASNALDMSLHMRAESGHDIVLVQRLDGVDMLRSDYRHSKYWKCDPMVHIAIVPPLVDELNLRLEYNPREDEENMIKGIVYDRFFYLAGGDRIDNSTVVSYMNLDVPQIQNMDTDPLAALLVRNMSRTLKHDLFGICILQHLGGDFAFRVFGDQILPCDVLGMMRNMIEKEEIL